ncbi:MAG TPA: hypothetical protein VLF66_13310 [Thermoanaerobaculia bacterium]|nr:hypothetical protein [Thermoanaerobaculia bacterium]
MLVLATAASTAVAQPSGETGDAGAAAVPDEPAEGSSGEIGELRFGNSAFRFYGFARLDAIYDDSRPDALQTPTFIRSEDPSAGPGGEDSLTLHPRLTRFGVDLDGPVLDPLGGARLGGKLEIDFQNGGRESRAVPRYRHAYLTLGWEHSTLLVGQTCDLIYPLYPEVNADTLMWNAGNLGDRRAQVRWTFDPAGTGLTFAAAAGLTGAVDSQDLDGDGVRDGEDSGVPNLQARLGWSRSVGGGDLAFGLWGYTAREEVQVPVSGETEFESFAAGLDFSVPLPGSLTLRGELWTGENLSDVRGGIGQGVNAATGREIASRGGWAELGWKSGGPYSLYTGATLDDPDDDDLRPGDRSENSAWYLVQRLDFTGAFRVGLDYLRWTTEYVGLDEGTDNRLNLYIVYFF